MKMALTITVAFLALIFGAVGTFLFYLFIIAMGAAIPASVIAGVVYFLLGKAAAIVWMQIVAWLVVIITAIISALTWVGLLSQ